MAKRTSRVTISREVRKAAEKNMRSRKVVDAAYKAANLNFKREVRELVREYEAHPVTKEIQGGADSRNISNTLGGRGNLFTFIGFKQGQGDPTGSVSRVLLVDSYLLRGKPSIRSSGSGKYTFTFRGSIPSKESISSVSRMPWESGRSWVFAVERGISGLGHYIYRRFVAASRSGQGIQVKGKASGMVYRPISYMSGMLNKFKTRLIT